MSDDFVIFDRDDVEVILNYYHQHSEAMVDKTYWFVKQALPEEEPEVIFDVARLTAIFVIGLRHKEIPLEAVDWEGMIRDRRVEVVREVLDEYDHWVEVQMGLHG